MTSSGRCTQKIVWVGEKVLAGVPTVKKRCVRGGGSPNFPGNCIVRYSRPCHLSFGKRDCKVSTGDISDISQNDCPLSMSTVRWGLCWHLLRLSCLWGFRYGHIDLCSVRLLRNRTGCSGYSLSAVPSRKYGSTGIIKKYREYSFHNGGKRYNIKIKGRAFPLWKVLPFIIV